MLLLHLMRHGSNERVPGTAAQALLDRGWGKPKVEVATVGWRVGHKLLYQMLG
jgi:hypothetical protein